MLQNIKKVCTLVLICGAVCLCFGACSGDDNDPDEQTFDFRQSTNEQTTNEKDENETTTVLQQYISTTAATTTQSPYTEKQEYVWATADVNVRQSPSTDAQKVGKLHEGNKVLRLAKGSDGWSRVDFEGKECYIFSQYLTTAEPFTVSSNRIVVDPTGDDWNLVVVNTEREIPQDYVPKLAEVVGSGVYLDYRVAPYYDAMYAAAKADGIILTPYSGYRSYQRQQRNYNNLTQQYMTQYGLSKEKAAEKAATVILPPGTSEHNLGLAMDICNTNSSFKEQKEYKWLMEHAHEYGFILRYTAEKQPVTGIIPEPWHWRFVGVEYAEKIKNSGLCLEEYLGMA